jgi:hypothetical protein
MGWFLRGIDVLSRFLGWLQSNRWWRRAAWLIGGGLVAGLLYGLSQVLSIMRYTNDPRLQGLNLWRSADLAARRDLITVRREACPGAPFIMPADGFVGLLYGDPRGPYSLAHRHQGIDIFSASGPGETPVYAAYDGYLTRETDWKSSLIIRVPDDPLHPGRQIWLYYTHMADKSGEHDFIDDTFSPGTHEVFVEQGTLLGYTGEYSGDPLHPIWVHLHFSIVLDNGSGGYRNELDFANTVDPSRYLGMAVNVNCAPLTQACTPEPLCKDAYLGPGGR